MTEKFKPESDVTDKLLSIRCSEDQFNAVGEAARKFGVSKQSFCRQALMFALKHMDEPS